MGLRSAESTKGDVRRETGCGMNRATYLHMLRVRTRVLKVCLEGVATDLGMKA